jgi:hypothetical protein
LWRSTQRRARSITASGEPLTSSNSSSHTGSLPVACDDRALVERQLDDAEPRAHLPRAAADVGAKERQQRRRTGLLQALDQRIAAGRSRMQRQLDHVVVAGARRQRHVVLGACHGVVAGAFQRLHTAPALVPDAQRAPRLRQLAAGGVEIDRPQALPGSGRAPGDGRVDGRAPCRRHLVFQLDFVHPGMMPRRRGAHAEGTPRSSVILRRLFFDLLEAPTPVGFLDDLKRQADALKAQQTTDLAALARNTALTEAACKTAFTYFNTLNAQLGVLQPKSHARFELDRKHVFDALALVDFRVDARRKRLREEDVTDFIVLHWQLRSGRKVQLSLDFLPEIQKLEPRLRQSGAEVDTESVRDPDNGRLQAMRYTFTADFRASVRMTPHHDVGTIHFQLHNLDGFESISVEFPALEVGSARLDELARWLVGQPHRFLDDGRNLRRVEA